MRTNTRKTVPEVKTHGGATAFPHINPVQALRRSVLATMLFEDQFYEDGQSAAERIAENASRVPMPVLCQLAIEARSQYNLRHVPLLLLLEAIKRGGTLVATTIEKTIQRPDELTELLALYWKANPPQGKDKSGRPKNAAISKQMKKGLALAFRKFSAYSLAKYNQDNAIKLRDVLFLVHAKPKDETQAQVWKHLVDGTLQSPDTWEVELSAGKDKKATFERLIREDKLGYLALLRNLRNMEQAGVDTQLVRDAIEARKNGAERVLPFRYIAAAKQAPRFEEALDKSLVAGLAQMPKLPGKTVIIVDVSGSMWAGLSAKSDMTRMHAAAALGAIAREVCEESAVYATAGSDMARIHQTALVPPRRGVALVDAIADMCILLGGGGIFLTQVMEYVYEHEKDADRIIVITDEQDCSGARSAPAKARVFGKRNYLINVASYRNGIGYGKWTHIDGFSEAIFNYIREFESIDSDPSQQASAAA